MVSNIKKYRFYNVISQSSHGAMIVNRLDRVIGDHVSKYGSWAETESNLFVQCLKLALKYKPQSKLLYLEVGANIGSHLIPVVKAFDDQIEAHAFEAQRLVYYVLAGNVALQSFENCHVHHIAIGAQAGHIDIAIPRYDEAANFGAFEISNGQAQTDFKGKVSQAYNKVAMQTIDSFAFQPSFIKIDVEGMEPQVLAGAMNTLRNHQPVIYLEYHKCGLQVILDILKPLGYIVYDYPVSGDKNLLAIPPWLSHVTVNQTVL